MQYHSKGKLAELVFIAGLDAKILFLAHMLVGTYSYIRHLFTPDSQHCH